MRTKIFFVRTKILRPDEKSSKFVRTKKGSTKLNKANESVEEIKQEPIEGVEECNMKSTDKRNAGQEVPKKMYAKKGNATKDP